MQFDRGYLSAYFVTDAERMEVVLEDPYILVHEKKISVIKDLLPLLEKSTRRADRCSSSPRRSRARPWPPSWSTRSAYAHRLRGQGPGFGDRRKAMMEDIAILTGARAIMEDIGVKLDGIRIEDLGSAARGGGQGQHHHRGRQGNRADVKARVKQIAPRSPRPRATTTARSSRRGSPAGRRRGRHYVGGARRSR